MNETSLNAKCGIEGFSSFQNNLAHELGYIGTLFPIICSNEIYIPKLKQMNHQTVICIYEGDLIGYEMGSWIL